MLFCDAVESLDGAGGIAALEAIVGQCHVLLVSDASHLTTDLFGTKFCPGLHHHAALGPRSSLQVFLSDGYFSSANAMRELRAALDLRMPLLFVRETHAAKGGVSMERLRSECPPELRGLLSANQIVEWQALICSMLQ